MGFIADLTRVHGCSWCPKPKPKPKDKETPRDKPKKALGISGGIFREPISGILQRAYTSHS